MKETSVLDIEFSTISGLFCYFSSLDICLFSWLLFENIMD